MTYTRQRRGLDGDPDSLTQLVEGSFQEGTEGDGQDQSRLTDRHGSSYAVGQPGEIEISPGEEPSPR